MHAHHGTPAVGAQHQQGDAMTFVTRERHAYAGLAGVRQQNEMAAGMRVALGGKARDFEVEHLMFGRCLQRRYQNKRPALGIIDASFHHAYATAMGKTHAEWPVRMKKQEMPGRDHHLAVQIDGIMPHHHPGGVALGVEAATQGFGIGLKQLNERFHIALDG